MWTPLILLAVMAINTLTPSEATCKCPKNEVYDKCPAPCPPRECGVNAALILCTPSPKPGDPDCKPGCRCADGYLRNRAGFCIPEGQCKYDCPKNETLDPCCSPCPPRYCGVNIAAVLCPVTTECEPGCRCSNGYLRNGDGICVLGSDCPPRCGPNERFEESPSKVCEPMYCSELGFPLDCPPVDDPDCEDTPGCICVQGYVRDKLGKCIPKSECHNTLAFSYTKSVGCLKAPTNLTTSPSTVNVTEARARLVKGSIILASEFLYQLVSSKPDENSVVSGASVMIPLAQLAIWTKKLVLEQILKLLNLYNKDEIRSVFLELTKSNANQQNVQFEVANKYFVNKRYPLSANFKRESKVYFHSEDENLDFSKNEDAADTINDWVKNRTHGRIEDFVTKDMFSAATRLVIANAIYFLGGWVHQFNVNDTKTKDFYKRNGETVPVELMYQKNSFKYAENDMFQVLELPYKGYNFSCLFILPRKVDGLLETADFLRNPAEFCNIYDAMNYEQVAVCLPKIKTTTQSNMGKMLKKTNVTAMFDPNNDDILGILEKHEPLYVSKVVQKAFILTDEKRTEAAAATDPPNVYVFNANRPFLFYIKSQEMVLFCGAIVT